MNTSTCIINVNPISSYPAHTHAEWEVIIVTQGALTAIIDGKEYALGVGDVTVIPPGTVHDNISDGLYVDAFLRATRLDFNAPAVVHDSDGSIMELFKMLNKVMTEKDLNYSKIADSLTATICAYIKRQMNHSAPSYPFVDKLKSRIYENLSNADFDISSQIKKIGFNSDYLRRCFKEASGETPLEYMTRLRVSMAESLLINNPQLSVKQISEACGFNDSFYFSTCFKKHSGYSPREYRSINK